MKVKNTFIDHQEARRHELESLIKAHNCTLSLTEYGPEGCICLDWKEELEPTDEYSMEEPY